MTFASRTFFAMATGNVVSFSPGVSNNSAALGVRSGSLSLSNDGTGTQTQLGSSHALSWYAPAPSTGIGSSIWAKLTINTTSNTVMSGSSTGVVLSLSGGLGWTFTSSASNQEGTGTFTLNFYGDSGGTNLLSSQRGSWDVGYTP